MTLPWTTAFFLICARSSSRSEEELPSPARSPPTPSMLIWSLLLMAGEPSRGRAVVPGLRCDGPRDHGWLGRGQPVPGPPGGDFQRVDRCYQARRRVEAVGR